MTIDPSIVKWLNSKDLTPEQYAQLLVIFSQERIE